MRIASIQDWGHGIFSYDVLLCFMCNLHSKKKNIGSRNKALIDFFLIKHEYKFFQCLRPDMLASAMILLVDKGTWFGYLVN